MKKITIQDKTFAISITQRQIKRAIIGLAARLELDYRDKEPLFLCVLNGSFMFAADLLKLYNSPCQISFIKLASYQGTSTTEEVKTLIGLNEDIRDRDLIILEDIVDTGITISHLVEDLSKYGPRSISIATLLLKPAALRTMLRPDYVGMEIPNDFIVGYGLDYNGFGRNTPHIYKIVE